MVIRLLRRRAALPGAVALVAGIAVPFVVPAPAHAGGTITVQVTGQGRVTGPGIDCYASGGPDCSELYEDQFEQICDPERKPPCHTVRITPVVELTAAPGANGYAFVDWIGCTSADGTSCTIEVDSSGGVTAQYRDVQPPQTPTLAPYGDVRGTRTITAANVHDNSGALARVEFFVPGIGTFSDTSPPYSFDLDTTLVPDGSRWVTAYAFDMAGNRSDAGGTQLEVDNTAPTIVVASGPDGQVLREGTTQDWTFAVTEPRLQTTRCSVEPAGSPVSESPGDWATACASADGHTVSGLPDGQYTFRVAAWDRASNFTVVERAFSIDGTPPATRIAKGPQKAVKTRTRRAVARFVFASSEAGSSYQCQLDDRGYRACSARSAFRVTPGRHVLRVRAIDEVGNRDATPAVWRWRVVRVRR